MVRIRLTIWALAALVVAVATGCGSGGGSGGGSGSGSDLAGVVPPGSVVFAEADLKPQGKLESDSDSLAVRLTGQGSLGAYVISKLESAARKEGRSLDFAGEVEPWLGDRGAVAFARIAGGELSEPLIAVQTTDPKAAQAFVDKKAAEGKEPSKDASYEGVGFKVGSKGSALGLIGETLVLAHGEKEFKAAISASRGDSLGDEDRFQRTFELASDGSLADVYVDLGGVLGQSQGETELPVEAALKSAGIDAAEATAVASVIPHSSQVEIEVSSELGSEEAPSGNASKLLGSLPASSVAAFSFAGFDAQLEEAIDNLDEEGLSSDLKPGELKSSLKQAGVDLDKIAASLDEGAIFLRGRGSDSLDGALVATADSSEAAEAVAGAGTLLKAAGVPGVTAISRGGASGFLVHSKVLGSKPLVFVGKGNRIAIGYRLAPALAVIDAPSEATLSGQQGYKEAVTALGKTPISGFVDGPQALRLAKALVSRSNTEFWQAVPYLSKVTYVAIGSGPGDEVATAKVIAGVGK